MTAFISCRRLVKVYKIDSHELLALRGADIDINKGEWISIIGPSGSGKSTLLNLLGGLDTPTAGQLIVDGQDLLSLKGAALTRYRLNRVGFMWQQAGKNLLGNRSALRNVTLPMNLAGVVPWKRAPYARELLDAVGLADQARKRPGQLSGGQQQRVGLAVALANKPDILLADEPTGALDRKVAVQVMNLLENLRQRYNLTILMATHDLDIAGYADRVLTLRDGALGQNLTADSDESPKMDKTGNIQLPEGVREQLSAAPRISVEIRPEGILLRPEKESSDDVGTSLQEMLPQDAPPERRRLFGRKPKGKVS